MYCQTDITRDPIDPAALQTKFQHHSGEAGAIATFTGIVRGEGDITSLTLSHYQGFTESEVEKIARQATMRWPLTACQIVHRVGLMHPGDVIVFVAAASKHRRAAFEAVDFVMDYLKSDAPFWKQEMRSGKTKWIEPRLDDLEDKTRWQA